MSDDNFIKMIYLILIGIAIVFGTMLVIVHHDESIRLENYRQAVQESLNGRGCDRYQDSLFYYEYKMSEGMWLVSPNTQIAIDEVKKMKQECEQ